MKSRVYYRDDDTMLINGRYAVPVAARRVTKDGRADGLEPSMGFKKRVMTPWGALETCTITPTPGYGGRLEYCAQVSYPKSNPHVRFCTFWVDI